MYGRILFESWRIYHMSTGTQPNPSRDELLARVLALPASDREFIAERIDETIDHDAGFANAEVAKAWADEVARRIEMIDKGLVKPLPADIALRQAREHLERRRAERAAS
jgi:hypothetical protein